MSSVSLSHELFNLRVDMEILKFVVPSSEVNVVTELMAGVWNDGSLVGALFFKFLVCLTDCIQYIWKEVETFKNKNSMVIVGLCEVCPESIQPCNIKK